MSLLEVTYGMMPLTNGRPGSVILPSTTSSSLNGNSPGSYGKIPAPGGRQTLSNSTNAVTQQQGNYGKIPASGSPIPRPGSTMLSSSPQTQQSSSPPASVGSNYGKMPLIPATGSPQTNSSTFSSSPSASQPINSNYGKMPNIPGATIATSPPNNSNANYGQMPTPTGNLLNWLTYEISLSGAVPPLLVKTYKTGSTYGNLNQPTTTTMPSSSGTNGMAGGQYSQIPNLSKLATAPVKSTTTLQQQQQQQQQGNYGSIPGVNSPSRMSVAPSSMGNGNGTTNNRPFVPPRPVSTYKQITPTNERAFLRKNPNSSTKTTTD